MKIQGTEWDLRSMDKEDAQDSVGVLHTVSDRCIDVIESSIRHRANVVASGAGQPGFEPWSCCFMICVNFVSF